MSSGVSIIHGSRRGLQISTQRVSLFKTPLNLQDKRTAK